jgi:hypothetical protein
VPGINDRIWGQSMEDTRIKCYDGYYTASERSVAHDAALTMHFSAALLWVKREQYLIRTTLLARLRVTDSIPGLGQAEGGADSGQEGA